VTIAKRPSYRVRDARKSARDLPDVTSENACDTLPRRANQLVRFDACQEDAVIPGRREASSPESITTAACDGFLRPSTCDDALTAIAREKELKKWRRDWKIRLIEEQNPEWGDLYPRISNRRLWLWIPGPR
jgi:hypothetical protein